LMALERGAKILRVHDVSETMDAVKIWVATQDCL
jgi:dihydropteroate synthase